MTTTAKLLPRVAIAIAISFPTLPSTSLASGYYVTGVGVRGMGRAAAVAVGSDDLTAQYYNPAALIRLDKQLTLQAAGVDHAITFDRTDDGETFDPVTNSDPAFIVPSFGIAHSFGRDDLTVAFGLYTPYAPTYKFPAEGAQRFSLVSSEVIAANIGPSAAFQVSDSLTLGAGVAYSIFQLNQQLVTHVSPLQFPATDDPNYDTTTTISVADDFAIAWNLGMLYQAPDSPLTFGLAVVGPTAYDATGSIHADFSRNTYYVGDSLMGKLIANADATDDDVAINITLPPIARAGVLYEFEDDLEVELNVAYQAWSWVGTLMLEGTDLAVQIEGGDEVLIEGDVEFPLELRDAFSIRLGGEKKLSDRLRIRGGTFFETAAVELDDESVFLPDAMKFGYGLGATIGVVSDLALDVGWMQAFAPEHEVDSSDSYQIQIDPASGIIAAGKIVGNGTYASTWTLFGAGLNWAF